MNIAPNKNFCSYCGTDLRVVSKNSTKDNECENDVKEEISKDIEPERDEKSVDPFEVLTKKEEPVKNESLKTEKTEVDPFSVLLNQDKPKDQGVPPKRNDSPKVPSMGDVRISEETLKILTEEGKTYKKMERKSVVPDRVQYSTKIDGYGFGYAAFFSYVYSPVACVASVILAIASLVNVFEIDYPFLAIAAYYLFRTLIMLCSSLKLRYFSRFALDGVLIYHVLNIFVCILFCFIKESYAFGGIVSIVLLIISFVYFCIRREYYTE